MKATAGTLLAMLLLALSACGGSGFDDDFTSDNIIQQTLTVGTPVRLTLTSGAYVDFPGNTFAEDTIVIFSDLLTSTDGNVDNYPTVTPVAEDLLAGIVLNTPVDELHGADLPVRFSVRSGLDLGPTGTQYIVYRFDFDNQRWERWGSTTATVDASGNFATASLPTDEMRGFVGSVAIFEGLTTGTQPAPVTTTIEGTVITGGGGGVATSVSVYYLVGSIRFPVDLINGTIPSGGEFANVVQSNASGDFTAQLPDHMIGALVGLVFGEYDDSIGEEEEFDLLAPATPLDEVESMTVRYGENNVRSQPVS